MLQRKYKKGFLEADRKENIFGLEEFWKGGNGKG